MVAGIVNVTGRMAPYIGYCSEGQVVADLKFCTGHALSFTRWNRRTQCTLDGLQCLTILNIPLVDTKVSFTTKTPKTKSVLTTPHNWHHV